MARSERRSSREEEADALEQMSEVLAAEARVREVVASCREDLNRDIADAQEWARGLTRRINARLTRLHTRCDQKIQARIAELRTRAEEAAPPVELDSLDRQSLEATIEQLADQLIGRRHG